jgi:hypothetical protein
VLFVTVPIGAAISLAAPQVLAATPAAAAGSTCPAPTGATGVAALVCGLSNAATSPNGVSHWGATQRSPPSWLTYGISPQRLVAPYQPSLRRL